MEVGKIDSWYVAPLEWPSNFNIGRCVGAVRLGTVQFSRLGILYLLIIDSSRSVADQWSWGQHAKDPGQASCLFSSMRLTSTIDSTKGLRLAQCSLMHAQNQRSCLHASSTGSVHRLGSSFREPRPNIIFRAFHRRGTGTIRLHSEL